MAKGPGHQPTQCCSEKCPAAGEESPGNLTALPICMYTHLQSILQCCGSAVQPSFPLFQRRQEKAQNKLPTLKWKMFLRQLIGPSLHLHICYLCVVHLFALRRLFLITLFPLLEGNIFNQINLKTVYFVCLHVAERKRGLKKRQRSHSTYRALLLQLLKHKEVQNQLQAGSFPCRAAHQEQTNRTNIPTLWISGGLSQTWPLEIQSRGFFFFLCVCESQFHG